MGNVKQPVLLQQGQLVFIECEIGTVITSVCYLLLPWLFRLLKCSRYILRQPLWCNVSRGASKNPTFIWDQCKIISRILISSGINSYGSSCVWVCVAKEAVWLATDQLLLSSQRHLNREIFVAACSGAACERGRHLCRWYRGGCLHSLLHLRDLILSALLYAFKLSFTSGVYYYCAPNKEMLQMLEQVNTWLMLFCRMPLDISGILT